MLADTHALLLNGCVFDELPAALVAATARQARVGGAAVFFDPGTLMCASFGRAATSHQEKALILLTSRVSGACGVPR